MAPKDQLVSLLAQLYAAPGTQDGWQPFLEALARPLRASGVAFVSHNRTMNKGHVASAAGFAPEAIAQYASVWGAHDPWAHSPAIRTLKTGSVCLGERLVPQEEMWRTAYYNEFALCFDIPYCLIGLLESNANAFACLTLNGGRRRGRFDAHSEALLTALMPHLHRALRVHRRLVAAESDGTLSMDVLDRLPHALLVLDGDGRVRFVNRHAGRLLAEQDGIFLDGRQLRGATVVATDTLRSALHVASSVAAGESTRAAVTVRLPRPSGDPPYVVLAAPLPQPGLDRLTDRAAVLVAISEPGRVASTESSDRVLETVLGLTPAEAKLARLTASGLTLREAALHLGWREESARTRMKSVLAKTGSVRQARLVELVIALTTI